MGIPSQPSDSEDQVTAEIFIAYGRVQGVGFRAFVERTAKPFEILGYVQNLSDGTVKIFAQGLRSNIDQLAIAVTVAPPPIKVQRLERRKSKTETGLTAFEIKLHSFDR
jgi:acylphosphatase